MARKGVSDRPPARKAEPEPRNTLKRGDNNPGSNPEPEQENTPAAAESEPEVQRQTFPIVGIGASAGGLEAFSELLHALPERTGIAFVFIQH